MVYVVQKQCIHPSRSIPVLLGKNCLGRRGARSAAVVEQVFFSFQIFTEGLFHLPGEREVRDRSARKIYLCSRVTCIVETKQQQKANSGWLVHSLEYIHIKLPKDESNRF